MSWRPEQAGPLGAPVRRREDERFLTGKGRYVDDLPADGALHVAFVRSLDAHGEIESVDASAALEVPGVVRVLVGAELAAHTKPIRQDMPGPDWQSSAFHALAVDRVRFVGEPVAAVVADGAATAADAAELVVVDVRQLEAVVDVEQALRTSTRLHDGWTSNVFYEHRVEGGDVDAAFARADGVVRLSLRNRRQLGLPLEPRACVASYGDGLLTLWTSSQVPQMVRAGLARQLGLPQDAVRVVSPDVGGGFGVKQQMFPEEIVLARLAYELGTTVRWNESSSEHLMASVHAREQYHEIEAAYDRTGRVLGVRAQLTVDCGAYSTYPSGAALDGEIAASALPGPYDLPDLRIDVRSVATNKCPVGPYRGVGRPSANFSIERVMDAVARELDMTPAAVRRRNFIPSERFPYRSGTGVLYDSGDYHAVLDTLLEAADLPSLGAMRERARAQGRFVGVGLAFFTERSSFTSAGRFTSRGVPLDFEEELGEVSVGPDGRIEVKWPNHNHGQGHETTVAQIVSSVLCTPMDVVDVLFGDTETTPRGIGTFNSRSVVAGGGMVLQAAEQVRDLALAAAAVMLDQDVKDLVVSDEGVRSLVAPPRALSFGEIASWLAGRPADTAPDLPRRLEGSATFGTEQAMGVVSAGAHLAVVEVDPDLGTSRIQRYIAVEDCGVILNPLIVAGQILGGIAQGIGGALLEEFVYDQNGQPITVNLADYVVPGAWDVPEVEMHHVVTPSPFTPHGGKGMAEGAVIPVAAVLAAAIDDALDPLGAAPVAEVPFTPERIHRLVAESAANRMAGPGA